MRGILSIVRTVFFYITFLLNPKQLLLAVRVLYFSAPQRNSSSDDGMSVPVPLIVLQNIAIIGALSAAAHDVLRRAGHQFSWATALRVIVGYLLLIVVFFLWHFIRQFLRPGTTGEQKSRGSWRTYFYMLMPGPLLGAFVAGLTGNLLLGTLVAGGEVAQWPVMLMASLVAQRALFGCAYGAALGLLSFGLARVGLLPLRLWLTEVLVAFGGAAGFILVMLGAVVALRQLQRRLTPIGDYILSILTLYVSSLGFASLLHLGMGYLKQSAPSIPSLALILGLMVSRLPLWPIEAIWAWLWRPAAWHRAGQPRPNTTRTPPYAFYLISDPKRPYRRAMRSTFFDRRQMVPLPGEADALVSIGKIDVTLACEEAIELLNLSPRMHTAGHALVALAQQSPVLAYHPITSYARSRKEFAHLPGWVGSNLTRSAALVWKVLEALRALALAEQLQALMPVSNEPPSARPGIMAPSSEVYEKRTAALVTTCRQALTALQDDLQRATSGPDAPAGAALLADFIQQALRELSNDRWDGITPINIDKELLATLATAVVPKGIYENLANGLASENWLANTIQTLKTETSQLKRRNRFLGLLAQMQMSGPLFFLSIGMAGLNDTPLEPELKLTFSLVQLHWRALLTVEARRLAEEEPAGPIETPYVLGQPVRGPLFIGREDLMRQLRAMWGELPQWSSVLLHGHRRMGKSSILHNLPSLFEGRAVIVAHFNLQSLGEIKGAGEFLYTLAREIWRAARGAMPGLSEPAVAAFDVQGGYEGFREYLHGFSEQRSGYRLVITLDEYEQIDQYFLLGVVEERFLQFLRSLLDQHPWLCVVFAGLHTHNELNGGHWQHLFRTVLSIRVSFLSQSNAYRLLAEPTPDFPVSYDNEVLLRAYQLTAGQPFLLQLVGYSLIQELNTRRRTDPHAPVQLSMLDLYRVLADPDFYQRGAGYFEGVRQQVATDSPPAALVLRALAVSEKGMDGRSLQAAAGLPEAEFRTALDLLGKHQVVWVDRERRIRFTVELMRCFIAGRPPAAG